MNSTDPAPCRTTDRAPQIKLSKEAINALPLFHYEGKVTLARTAEELDAAVARLSRESVLGFDTETPPTFRRGKSYAPTLVQLAGAQEVVLFHLKWQPLGSGLISLLANPAIIKTGVAVHDDIRFLAKITPFEAQSIIDLSRVAQYNKIENLGLRGLAAAFLGLRISKSEQCSNWGASELSSRQIRYAATDAWASRSVYRAMQEAGLNFSLPEAPPPRQKKTGPRPRRKAKASVPLPL